MHVFHQLHSILWQRDILTTGYNLISLSKGRNNLEAVGQKVVFALVIQVGTIWIKGFNGLLFLSGNKYLQYF